MNFTRQILLPCPYMGFVFSGTFNNREMEHPSIPPDSGQDTVAAAAGVAARGKGKVSSGRPSSSSGRGSKSAARLFPVGCGSSPATGVLPFGHRPGPAAGVLPVGRGSGAAPPLLSIGSINSAASPSSSSMAASGAAESSPIGALPAAFPCSPSPSQAWWGSDTASPTWDSNLHPHGGFMGILNSHASPHYAPFKAPIFF